DDASRPRLYIGQASVYTPAGALPLNFELEAGTLAEAIEKFPAAANQAVEDTMRQLQEMRREAASSLVVPGQGPGAGGKGGIQIPRPSPPHPLARHGIYCKHPSAPGPPGLLPCRAWTAMRGWQHR